MGGSSSASDGTAIGDLAELMQPGEWAELQTTGLDAAIGNTGGASDHILTYSQEGKWNPGTRQLFFIGGDHFGGPQRFIHYSAATNSWVVEPRPPWMPSTDNPNHSYDYQAIDPANGIYFYDLNRYEITTKTWTQLTEAGLPNFSRAHRADEYFVGLGLVRHGDGGAYVLKEGASSWNTLAPQGTLKQAAGGLHPVSEYNTVHNLLIFGAGDSNDQLYKMDVSESITPLLPMPPIEIGAQSFAGILTVDPVTGDYLVITVDAQFWQYDVVRDAWTQLSASVPHIAEHSASTKTDSLIASPISTYGVVMVVQWRDSGSKVWLYKHEQQVRPAAPSGLIVQ